MANMQQVGYMTIAFALGNGQRIMVARLGEDRGFAFFVIKEKMPPAGGRQGLRRGRFLLQ